MTWFPAKVEIAYGTSPTDDPSTVTWTDVTSDVKTWNVHSGRTNEFDSIEASTATVTLYNDNGQYTPGRYTGKNLLPWNYEFWYGMREPWTYALHYWDTTIDPNYGWTLTPNLSFGGFLTHSDIEFNIIGDANPKEARISTTNLVGLPIVSPGVTYAANVSAAMEASAEPGYAFISWLDHDLVEISRSNGTATTIQTSYTDLAVSGVAPTGACYATIGFQVTTSTNNRVDVASLKLEEGSYSGPESMASLRPPTLDALLRISVQDSGGTYHPVFTGHVESSVEINESGSLEIASVDIMATDLQKYLSGLLFGSQLDYTNGYYGFKDSNPDGYLMPLQEVGSSLQGTNTLDVYTQGILGTTAIKFSSGAWELGDYGPDGLRGLRILPINEGYIYNLLYADLPFIPDNSSPGVLLQGWFRAQLPNNPHYDVRLFRWDPVCDISLDGTLGYLKATIWDPYLVINPSVVLADGQWHHIAVTLLARSTSTVQITLWADGVVVSNGTYAANSTDLAAYPNADLTSMAFAPTQDLGFTLDASMIGALRDTTNAATIIPAIYAAGVGATTNDSLANVISHVLKYAGGFDTWASISGGQTTQVPVAIGSGSVMDELQSLANSSDGTVFINESGQVTYYDYDHRLYPVPGITLDESMTPESDLVWSDDSSTLYSKVTVNGTDSGTVSAQNSSLGYGVVESTVDTVLADTTQMNSLANWILYLRGPRRTRVGSISFNLSTNPASLWDALVGWGIASNKVLDLSNVLRSQEPNVMPRYFIESFDWTYDQENLTFRVTCDLSPTKWYEEGLLRLGDDQYGQLGLYALSL